MFWLKQETSKLKLFGFGYGKLVSGKFPFLKHLHLYIWQALQSKAFEIYILTAQCTQELWYWNDVRLIFISKPQKNVV